MAAAKVYDAVIVGSGAVGGWAAKELTEQGMTVAVLDAGSKRQPSTQAHEHKQPYDAPFRGRKYGDRTSRARQAVQRHCVAYDEFTAPQFVDDVDNPYVTPEDRRFIWIRARQIGGRSMLWNRHVYRLSDLDFKAASRDGYGEDWPLGYADLAPYYDRVESQIGVTGIAEGLPQLPDGKFLAPMHFSCGEALLRTTIKQKFGRTLTMDRSATLTEPHNGRARCHYCGPCARGCVTRSFYSSPAVALPMAAATGRMTLVPDAIVSHVLVDDRGRCAGVYYVDRATRNHREVRAKVVVLSASTLESTRILLNSKSSAYPNGLANSSGVLGHYLMDSARGGGASGILPMLAGVRDTPGHRPTQILIVRYRNVDTKHPDFIRGYHVQGRATESLWEHAYQTPGFGAGFKQAVRDRRHWRVSFTGFGDCLPQFENFCELDPAKVDAWGIPALRIQMAWHDNERKLMKDLGESAAEMLHTAGAEEITASTQTTTPGLATHEVGTARMGADRKTSVLNQFAQAHDVRNLFVIDGATFTTSPCPNPTLTMMAIATRACEYLVREYRAGRV
jgi:glucoside 3-dehydrogenase (cytochrome c) catalytic subunit